MKYCDASRVSYDISGKLGGGIVITTKQPTILTFPGGHWLTVHPMKVSAKNMSPSYSTIQQ